MAEITRRRTGEFLRKLFGLLMRNPDGLKAGEALKDLATQFTLTPYEAGSYKDGAQRFEKIVRFATVDCVKAGWLVRDKGRWSITDEGRRAYEDLTDPEVFYKRAVQLYHVWKRSQPDAESETDVSGPTDPEALSAKSLRITYEEAEEQAWAEIQSYVDVMPPFDFQKLVAELLRAMGYHVQWIAPPGKDSGVDILASTDPLGTRPPRIKVQVKRQQQAVSVDVLRSFLAVIGDDDAGLFVATGGFTRDASDLARQQERRKITLVDLEKLFDLWVENYGKLTEAARQRLPLKPIYFLAPED